jgi:hypothetical protein
MIAYVRIEGKEVTGKGDWSIYADLVEKNLWGRI